MLDAIQEQLENIYGLRCEYRASDFVVDADSARKLGGSARAREELLVSEGEDGLELALYLHPSLTKPKSLGEFCEVVEGVSHFLYVVQAAREERHVSLLELEAQAVFGGQVQGWRTAVSDLHRQLLPHAAEPWAPPLYERLKVLAAALSDGASASNCLV